VVPPKASGRVLSDPLFGDVPMIEQDGSWHCDPAFRPRVPKNAVVGDVSKQEFCALCHVPKYFYVDDERRCVQCGATFTFSGREQKYWYESLKFNFGSVPVRCPNCRRQRRSDRAMHGQLAVARAAAREDPDDPAVLLSLARAIVELNERTGNGELNDAIAAARRAARLWPGSYEPLFWEGVAHARAGHRDRARDQLRSFVASAPRGGLERRARVYLAGLG
jgi:putative zinc ribbon protein